MQFRPQETVSVDGRTITAHNRSRGGTHRAHAWTIRVDDKPKPIGVVYRWHAGPYMVQGSSRHFHTREAAMRFLASQASA